MQQDFEKIKTIYENILKITVDINASINSEDFDKISSLIDKRGDFIREGEIILKNIVFSDKEKTQISILKKKIYQLESENIKKMEVQFKETEREISRLNINQKAISAYKFNKEANPTLVDSKE